MIYARRLDAHYDVINSDREELARVARKCVVDDAHFGFFIDAVDSQKFGIPTTASQAKCLSHMRRIKQKLTGVQLFKDDGLLLFRSLPDVKTGGNLTLTIIGHMMQHYIRDTKTADMYINFDGASDNMCYTVVYGLAHYLYCAAKSGWSLKSIHVLRFHVGHTHNTLDSTFGVLSRHVYGKHGTTARDLLSFPGFDSVRDDDIASTLYSNESHIISCMCKVCKEVFEEQLREIVDIRGVHDFNTFLRGCRPKSADRNVRMQYAFTFEARDGAIFVKSKQHCGADTPWGPWAKILPYPGTNVVHEPATCPRMEPPKPWPELEEEIAPSLIKFYERRYPHPVTIPQSDLASMRSSYTHVLFPLSTYLSSSLFNILPRCDLEG